MQVYKIEPNVYYSGGCALIAATNTEEAIKTYNSTEYKEYIYDEAICTCNLVNKLDYDTQSPVIILDCIYIE